MGASAAEVDGMDRSVAEDLAERLYRALASGDRDALNELLHPEFEGRTTAGLPLDLGGAYHGPDAMRREFWGRIARNFVARAEPAEFSLLDDGRLLVRGCYTGKASASGGRLEAEFIHLLSFLDGQVSGLVQLTDSGRWQQALGTTDGELTTVRFEVTDGLGVIRLNRPDVRNAINQALADELYEVALRCAARTDLRAVLIVGTGPAFTVGGDIAVFAETDAADLPDLLRRMTTPYHSALRLLGGLPVPVVAAVHGAVAGGGLGLLYCADIALAAEGTKFATGFAALGLSGDGANSWFLPRLVGVRRAAQLYFEQRVLDAREAAEWGLISRVVPADALEEQALALARRLADGPTRAFGEIRQLLRDSWSTTPSEQLNAETEALARTGGTSDAGQAIASFLAKATPTFQGW